MNAPLHDCVIRFWREDSTGRTVAGTGFLATGSDGNTYALTCAHVANLALGRKLAEDSPPQPGSSVTVDLMGRSGQVTLDLLEWRPPAPLMVARATDVADIAVFMPRAPFAAPYWPPLRIEPPNRVVPPGARVAFHSFGFMGTENGVTTQGALTAVDAGGWFVADDDEKFRRFIEEGLSGAPVFADGRVLGMVVQRLERDARQGLVIPAFALARAWPPLATPYPGLPAFDADTAHLFFGRGRAVTPDAEPTGTLKELLDRLNAQRLVALMGASGSGKSSLAKAGVADVYRRRGWTVLTLRPGLEPLRNLAEAIATEVEGLKPSPERLQAMDRWEQALEANRLAEALALARGQGAGGVLIVVDQFEEFFPGREDRADAARAEAMAVEMARQRTVILPQLRRAVERGEAHCLLTARLDLIAAMVGTDEEAAKLFKDPYPIFVLTRMAAREAREVIEGPSALFGARADAGFATDLAAAATQGEGRLPLLQETLRQCWAGLRRGPDGWRFGPPKAAETSDPARLLEESLARRGEQALAALRPNLKVPADLTDVQRVLLALVRLVAGQPVRRLLPLAELPAEDRALLDRLAGERLVVIDGEGRTAELVHEALMVRWPQLAGWIDGQRGFLEWRDRFERDFVVWRDGGREAKDALRRHDLATAQDWADGSSRVRGRPTADQADFIAASRAVHEAEDRRKAEQLRRTRQWLQMAVLALVLLAVTLAYAVFEGKRAESEAARAEAQTRVAEAQADKARQQSALAQEQAARAEKEAAAAQLQESRSLAIRAQSESARGDQSTAMLLALEALPEPAFGGKRPMSSEAAAALRQAWMRNRESVLVGHHDAANFVDFGPSGRRVITGAYDRSAALEGHSDWVLTASFSPDGRHVVTTSADRTARVWDLSGLNPTATVLEGHSDWVLTASFSPDGLRIVTASADRTARVWDLSGPTPTATILEGHKDRVITASFSPDGHRVVTTSSDDTARVWNLSDPKPTFTVLEGHANSVQAASFSPDGRRVVTASADRTARVWDLSGPTPTATVLEGHKDRVITASFNPDGHRVVTASDDKTARVWDLSAPLPTVTVLEGHTKSVRVASFSPDGGRVVTASEDNAARVWNLSDATPTATVLEGHTGWVEAASFSSDGRRVITASIDGTARVWDLLGGKLTVTILKGHKNGVEAASFSPDGRRVVTAAFDNTAWVWDLSGITPTVTVLEGHKEAVEAASFSPDGRRVVTTSSDGTARVWNLSGATLSATVLEGETGWNEAVSFSPDGRRIVTMSYGNTARVWDLSGAIPTATVLKGHTGWVEVASFSPDGSSVVTGSDDSTARVWDLSGPLPTVTVLKGHNKPVLAASFSPDGRSVVTGSADNTARVWDLSGGSPTATVLKGHASEVTVASFSSDGRRVVTAAFDGTARVWDLSRGSPTATVLEGHTREVKVASFSPDGRRIVTASDDNTTRVWDLSGDKPTATILEGYKGQVRTASFSPDGRHVVTASDDKTARVWDLSGDRPTAAILEGHSSKVTAASFSPDGRRIVTASDDNTARVWEIHPDIGELAALVRSCLTRCLSSAQREQFGLLVEDTARPRDLIPAPDASGLCPR